MSQNARAWSSTMLASIWREAVRYSAAILATVAVGSAASFASTTAGWTHPGRPARRWSRVVLRHHRLSFQNASMSPVRFGRVGLVSQTPYLIVGAPPASRHPMPRIHCIASAWPRRSRGPAGHQRTLSRSRHSDGVPSGLSEPPQWTTGTIWSGSRSCFPPLRRLPSRRQRCRGPLRKRSLLLQRGLDYA